MKNLNQLYDALILEDLSHSANYSYRSQMSMLVIKSLLPREGQGNRIYYKRYLRELDLWSYYRKDYNLNLKRLKAMDEKSYMMEDDSIFFRTLPLIIANNDLWLIEDESIKNMLFTTARPRTIIYNLSLVRLVYYLINGHENILDRVKDKTIALSYMDFMDRYEKFFRLDGLRFDKKYLLEFERSKIDVINALNTFKIEYPALEEVISLVNGEDRNFQSLEARSLARFLNQEPGDKLELPYLNFGIYLLNLRDGKIELGSLLQEDYIDPDIFQFQQGDVFYHSLLNQCKVISRSVVDNQLASLVQTKTGLYLFKK